MVLFALPNALKHTKPSLLLLMKFVLLSITLYPIKYHIYTEKELI